MSALDDLLDNLFNPFQTGALENPYAPPPSGTPSLTDPGTYTPLEPGSGPTPYVPNTPPPVIPGGDNGGGNNGGGNDGGGNNGGGNDGGGNDGGGNDGGGNDGGGNDGGGNPNTGGGNPNTGGGNPYDAHGGYARPAQLGGVDSFGHGKRAAVLTGHALSPPRTMSIDDFVNNVLPKAAGKHGEGMHYDPETGSVWSNISPEKMQELSDKKVAMMGVNTAYMTDDQLFRSYLMGHNPGAISGESMVRMGGDSGQYYFIDPNNPDQVVVYNYVQTMDGQPSFAGPGKDGGPPPSNILATPGQVGDPYAEELTQEQRAMMPALRNKMLAEQAAADELTAQQQEQTATGSELLMDLGEPELAPPPDLTPVVDPKQTIPAPSVEEPTSPLTIEGLPDLRAGSDIFNQVMESFGGGQGQSMLSPYGGFDFNMPLTMEEPAPEMAPPPMAPPSMAPGPDFGAGLQMGSPLMSPPQGPPGMPPTAPPPMAPPPMAPPPMAPPSMSPPPMAPPPMAPPSMAPPPPSMAPPPPPMAPPPMAPPPPAPTLPPDMPDLSPQQLAAIEKALAQMQGMSINFNQGGPVQSGVGSLFRREVMR